MFEFFDHKADIGVRGFGASAEEAFTEAAKAMLSIIVDEKSVACRGRFAIKTSADSLENLFVEFLNEMLFTMDSEEIIIGSIKVKKIIERAGKHYLEAEGWGEKKSEKHAFKTEVKAATYSQLVVKEEKGKWLAQCIVDV